MIINREDAICGTVSIEEAETLQDENPGSLIVEVVNPSDARRAKLSGPFEPRIYVPSPA